MADEVNGSIRYTAKELFERIDSKLDTIDQKLDDKVGRVEHEKLKKEVNALRDKITTLDTKMVRYIAIANTLVAIGILAFNHYLPA